VQIPEALEWLIFTPARYKVAYGGRGGAKSWSFCRALLVKAMAEPMRILCAREIQKSIKDSVHQLLSDQIKALGMQDFFSITANAIVGRNGSQFQFEGLRYNVDSIRSLEGIDVCAVFEAKNVSKNSWETLIPTIRKEHSEIWVEFNPELESDETYQRFVKNPPPNAIVKKISWRDNPWFPKVLREELNTLKTRDEDAYLNVWEGNCRVTLEGAIYASELRTATSEGRITRVPYDQRVPVHTFWDLGFSDCTSIWFAQKVGFEYHVIDCYQNRLKMLPHYLEVLQNKRYVYGTHYLPHDADHGSLAAEPISKQIRDTGMRCVTLQRIPDIKLGVNATRTIFNRLWFDEANCTEGLQALRHYSYEVDEHGQWSRNPKHDENSHYADGLRTLGESIAGVDKPKQDVQIRLVQYSKGEESAAWMA